MSKQKKYSKQIKSNITSKWETISVAMISEDDAKVLSRGDVKYVLSNKVEKELPEDEKATAKKTTKK